METAKPTRILKPFNGAIIRLFGRNKGSTDWNIAALNEQAQGDSDPSDGSGQAFAKIHSVAAQEKVSEVYAPRPTEFNAEICAHTDLRLDFSTNKDAMVEADYPDNWDVTIHRGVNADGCDVPKDSAFWLSSADCPTIVAYAPETDHLICAHAGLNCLLDRKMIDAGKNGKPSREHKSVVDAIVAKFKSAKVDVKSLFVFVTCGIGAHNFANPWTHEKFGVSNQKMEYYISRRSVDLWPLSISDVIISATKENDGSCRICLPNLIATQFMSHGVPAYSIATDGVDTFGDKVGSEFTWWSNRRGDSTKRNGIMVVHR